MSVIKNKRNLSDLEFFHNALYLRKEITDLLLRDFGVKNKVRTISAFERMNRMEDADKTTMEKIFDKYEIYDLLEEYPEWLITRFRSSIMDIMRSMILNITAANTIYPVHESEFYERRNFQNRAIGNCEQLLQEMQYVISIIPVNAQKYMRYVEMIEKEIALLKGWRKSDNKILKRIQGNQ